MIEIIFFCFVTSIIYFSAGYFFNTNIAALNLNYTKNTAINYIYGFIFLGFFSIIINFFFPLNQNINSILSIFFLVYFFYTFRHSKNKNKIIKSILLITFFSALLITLSEANRPDAGLYHFPYTKILNENKIIIGLTNIHFRFGHTSILQYLNALNFNFAFSENGILIPQAQIIVSVFLYFYKEFLNEIKRSDSSFLILFLFFTFLFSIFNYNRYGSFGNDASGNIFFLLLVYEFLKLVKKNNNQKKHLFNLVYLSLFCVALKPFLLFSLLFPLAYIINFKKKIYEIISNRNFYICLIFISCFLLKNLLISGCFIYPSSKTCISNLNWSNHDRTKKEEILGEAWSKDWVNFNNVKKINASEFNKDFIWFKTWKNNQFNTIVKKNSPFLVLSLIILIFLKLFLDKKKLNNKFFNKNFVIISTTLIIVIASLLFWFLKFPLYRYGSGFLGSLFIILFSLIFAKINSKLNLNIMKKLKIIIFISIIFIIVKNFNRIYNKYEIRYLNYPWPKMNSFTNNNYKKNYEEVIINNKFLFYKVNDGLCMYGNSPCSYYIEDNIDLKILRGYKMYYVKR